MSKLRKQKIYIVMNGRSTNMDFVNNMHIHDFLMHSDAKKVFIKLPYILNKYDALN